VRLSNPFTRVFTRERNAAILDWILASAGMTEKN